MKRPPSSALAPALALAAALTALGGAWVLACGVKALAGGAAQAVPSSAVSEADRVARGQRFYTQSCAHCHGETGDGQGEDGGADLRGLAASNARIANAITRGIKGEMPTFRKRYDPQEVSALVAYVRTFTAAAAP